MIAQILIADDDPDITGLLSDYLSNRGNRVIVANDGYQLAEKAGEHRPHLIIADIQMPGAYGSSAYLVLQNDAATKNIPVIFMSGHARTKIEKLLPNDPKTRFIQKPLDLGALYALITELLPLGGYCP
ncbi:MAG: response regulator [Elusimicrobiota bacterium]